MAQQSLIVNVFFFLINSSCLVSHGSTAEWLNHNWRVWCRGSLPFSMLHTCQLDLLRRRENNEWPEEVKTWVKSSKSEMTFLNSIVLFFNFCEAYRICRCICRLTCPIPSMETGSKARTRRLDASIFLAPNWWNLEITQLLPIPTWIQRIFFYIFVATVDLDFTSADLLGKVDVLQVAQKEGKLRNE